MSQPTILPNTIGAEHQIRKSLVGILGDGFATCGRARRGSVPRMNVWLWGRRSGSCCFVRWDDQGSRLDDNRTGARAGVAPGVGCDIVDGVGRYLRGVDNDVAHERAVQKCFVAEIMALVVGHDGAKVGVGVANLNG